MALIPVGLTRWENVTGERIEAYRRRLRAAGLDPIDLKEPADSLQGCRGLVLSGGVDIDPARYGEVPHSQTNKPRVGRDELEFKMLQEALAADLPVLAICRGHQLLNVHLGGSLLQHIEDESHEVLEDETTSGSHAVSLIAGSVLSGLYAQPQIEVNSRHHQAVTIDRLAPGLKVTALSDDNIVEAMEAAGYRWVIGVQWHPERTEPQIEGFEERSIALFRAFAEAVNP